MAPAIWNEQQKPNFQIGQDFVQTLPQANGKSEKRLVPISHPVSNAPICIECQALELTFFDPGCEKCMLELTSPSHILAVLRQWVPQVQQAIERLINVALNKMNVHADDRDSVTDMTFLMYACKSGASGVGEPAAAASVAKKLIAAGASLESRCKWTDMTALHYATYFDVGPVVATLLTASKGVDVDSPCQEYENGTALHISATNLCLEAAKVLLTYGADTDLKDELARAPIDCIPEVSEPEDDGLTSSFVNGTGDNSFAAPSEETRLKANKIRILLTKGICGLQKIFPDESRSDLPPERSRASSRRSSSARRTSFSAAINNGPQFVVSSKTVLQSLGMKVNLK